MTILHGQAMRALSLIAATTSRTPTGPSENRDRILRHIHVTRGFRAVTPSTRQLRPRSSRSPGRRAAQRPRQSHRARRRSRDAGGVLGIRPVVAVRRGLAAAYGPRPSRAVKQTARDIVNSRPPLACASPARPAARLRTKLLRAAASRVQGLSLAPGKPTRAPISTSALRRH